MGSLPSGMVSGARECAMSITDQFWQYANEAILLADNAETDEEKQTLFDLARTWTKAALIGRHAQFDTGNKAVAA
jgi:hypothetical protein